MGIFAAPGDDKKTLWYMLLTYIMAVCLIAVGWFYETASEFTLVLIFGVQKIFDSGGPGATTYIIPGEIFPTSVRASCHGASSASGKVGAFVGIYFMPVVQSQLKNSGMLILGGILLLVSMLLTCIFIPPYTEETLSRLRAATKTDISCTTKVLWGMEDDDSKSMTLHDP